MRLAILDRDGTILDDTAGPVDEVEAVRPLPGALEAIALLNHAGWHVVVASNQPGLGRGQLEMTTLNAIQARLQRLLADAGGRIDAFFYCPHTPEDACGCRKPAAGLFQGIGARFGIELAGVAAVGDSIDDLKAAHAAGCRPHLVRTGRGAAKLAEAADAVLPPGTVVHDDLAAFARHLAAQAAEAA